MKLLKSRKTGRKGTAVPSDYAKTVQAADSDDEFDDVLPTPAVTAGSSNAYELLLRGLDRLHDAPVPKVRRSKASKVKTRHRSTAGASPERAVDSTPAEQPLHDSNDASSSDDADDRSGGATEEAADTAEVADQGTADFFSDHFDGPSGVPADDGKASSSWTEDSQSRTDWPNTTWLTTGQSLPQVRQLCVPASVDNRTLLAASSQIYCCPV